MRYAGVGSRKTPNFWLMQIENFAERSADLGHVLTSGGAQGADIAFQTGMTLGRGKAVIYRPNEAFIYNDGEAIGHQTYHQASAYDKQADSILLSVMSEQHYNAVAKRPYVHLLHLRNVYIVLGVHMDQPVDCLVCWTPGGKLEGGTSTAIRIAEEHGIPVYNLGYSEELPW